MVCLSFTNQWLWDTYIQLADGCTLALLARLAECVTKTSWQGCWSHVKPSPPQISTVGTFQNAWVPMIFEGWWDMLIPRRTMLLSVLYCFQFSVPQIFAAYQAYQTLIDTNPHNSPDPTPIFTPHRCHISTHRNRYLMQMYQLSAIWWHQCRVASLKRLTPRTSWRQWYDVWFLMFHPEFDQLVGLIWPSHESVDLSMALNCHKYWHLWYLRLSSLSSLCLSSFPETRLCCLLPVGQVLIEEPIHATCAKNAPKRSTGCRSWEIPEPKKRHEMMVITGLVAGKGLNENRNPRPWHKVLPLPLLPMTMAGPFLTPKQH